MESGFWADLPRPIFGLSPMDGVTDFPYRAIQKKYGKPDVVFTEFTSAEGIVHGADRLLWDFLYDESQRPAVAQIFGKNPEAFRTTALLLCYLGFDGIDINMGCPAKSVQQHGSGAGLIRTPEIAQQLIRAVRLGIDDWLNGKKLEECAELSLKIRAEVMRRHNLLPQERQIPHLIPVSVKTRIGVDHPVVEEWIPVLLAEKPAVISIHGRTLKQMYTGQADWNEIAKAVKLAQGTGTLILGNGDIDSAETAKRRIQETGVDGVLVGRATYGNPWIFEELNAWRDGKEIPTHDEVKEKLQLAEEHSDLYEDTYPDQPFLSMRKQLAWYCRSFPNASQLRVALVQTQSADDVHKIIAGYEGDIVQAENQAGVVK